MKDMSKMLKAARVKKGLGLRETSRLSKVPVSTLSKLESGALQNPTFITILKLSPVLGIKWQSWFEEERK